MKKIFELILEVLYPSTLIEKRVREMTLDDFDKEKEVFFDEKNKILSLFKYKNKYIKEATRQIKYRRNGRLIKIFAEIIYAELLEEISDMALFENFNKPILVAIPMSRKERRERGYNQVELVVNEIVKIDDKTFKNEFNFLRKKKETKRQTELKREERLKNILDVFEADPKVKDQNIILIDDVITTGATINEARRVLRNAGAKKVFCVVMAK